ncbi:hypothetical protein KC326_g187 [Hortaea werneckii]|nr:hypothetical protein KC326_g187 [Hortaea werneckii]
MLYTVHPPATTSAVDRDAVAQRFPACTLYNTCCGPKSGKRSDPSVKAADLPACGEQTSCRRSGGLCGVSPCEGAASEQGAKYKVSDEGEGEEGEMEGPEGREWYVPAADVRQGACIPPLPEPPSL